MRTIWITMLTVAAAMLTTAAIIRAAEEPAAKKAPSQEEMMAAMTKAAAPGPEHEKLKMLAGKFNAEVTAMDPTGKEEKSTGMMTNEMVLGDRYVMQTYDGTMMGKPFKGGGLIGYDNMKKKYTMLWVDEMSTQMMMSEGTMDESAKTITTSGTFDCPMDGAKHTMRQVVTLSDADLLSLQPDADARTARDVLTELGLRGGAPRCVAVMIATLDGRAAIAGRSVALGHPADRALLRELRAQADAVLVGTGTLADERYLFLRYARPT